ncbi:MAG: MmgE/PrpD family protein [Proteobacteria bacterium]|nr:MmgE/PrpD family protein [Pseudomonadota bacterium]MBU2227772.1 MmgE/PrpD family protein [Pseudomonadota bacterium]MBU2261814.1 MmgE/PrpD family protein [Pseudomonadota bacterium]
MSGETLANRLAKHFCSVTFNDLSADHVAKMKLFILDWLGSAYAGKDLPPIRMMRKVAASLGGAPEATSIPDGARTNCLLASLLNGASSHIVEMDDLHRESILHPAAAILPAALAAGEREGVAGKDLIVATSAGYEVGIRLGLAVGPSHYRFWHTTSTCGTFGAAAAAAKALRLNEDQFAWAMGSAGTQAAGLWEFLGESAMSKQLHAGKAAMNGLLAALLAKEGFTGARRILEGEKGFFRATSQDFNESVCIADLGKVFHSERNSLKYHASCGHTHSAIDAAILAAGGRTLKPDEVEAVVLHIYQAAIDLLGNIEPKTPYLAKFNLPFCVATALRYGRVQPGDFTQERIVDKDLLQLMTKIRVAGDPDLTGAYPRKWPARVTIALKDGRRLAAANEYPKGDPENPLSEREVIEKFKGLTGEMLSPARAEAIIERVLGLESMGNVNELLK